MKAQPRRTGSPALALAKRRSTQTPTCPTWSLNVLLSVVVVCCCCLLLLLLLLFLMMMLMFLLMVMVVVHTQV